MFHIELYEECSEQTWDEFIQKKSMNGTFLQSRRFLNYHPAGRFKDASLLIYNEKNNLIAICPACEIVENGQKVFYSHKGSTFGGIIIDEKYYSSKYVVLLISELKDYLKKQGYKKVYLKMTSHIFSLRECDLFQYAFQYAGFLEHKELGAYIDYSTYGENIIFNFAQGKRTNVYNCVKQGLEVRRLKSEQQIAEFYCILCENLEKYDTKPVHNLSELMEFKESRLQEECDFFGIYKDEEMIAGAMMFYFERVKCAHTQYLAAKQMYNKLSPMTFLYYSLIVEMKRKGFKTISWGGATEQMGAILNMGLITSKEAFGSSYTNNLTYTIEL